MNGGGGSLKSSSRLVLFPSCCLLLVSIFLLQKVPLDCVNSPSFVIVLLPPYIALALCNLVFQLPSAVTFLSLLFQDSCSSPCTKHSRPAEFFKIPLRELTHAQKEPLN